MDHVIETRKGKKKNKKFKHSSHRGETDNKCNGSRYCKETEKTNKIRNTTRSKPILTIDDDDMEEFMQSVALKGASRGYPAPDGKHVLGNESKKHQSITSTISLSHVEISKDNNIAPCKNVELRRREKEERLQEFTFEHAASKEILENIFSHVTRSGWFVTMHVCKRWYEVGSKWFTPNRFFSFWGLKDSVTTYGDPNQDLFPSFGRNHIFYDYWKSIVRNENLSALKRIIEDDEWGFNDFMTISVLDARKPKVLEWMLREYPTKVKIYMMNTNILKYAIQKRYPEMIQMLLNHPRILEFDKGTNRKEWEYVLKEKLFNVNDFNWLYDSPIHTHLVTEEDIKYSRTTVRHWLSIHFAFTTNKGDLDCIKVFYEHPQFSKLFPNSGKIVRSMLISSIQFNFLNILQYLLQDTSRLFREVSVESQKDDSKLWSSQVDTETTTTSYNFKEDDYDTSNKKRKWSLDLGCSTFEEERLSMSLYTWVSHPDLPRQVRVDLFTECLQVFRNVGGSRNSLENIISIFVQRANEFRISSRKIASLVIPSCNRNPSVFSFLLSLKSTNFDPSPTGAHKRHVDEGNTFIMSDYFANAVVKKVETPNRRKYSTNSTKSKKSSSLKSIVLSVDSQEAKKHVTLSNDYIDDEDELDPWKTYDNLKRKHKFNEKLNDSCLLQFVVSHPNTTQEHFQILLEDPRTDPAELLHWCVWEGRNVFDVLRYEKVDASSNDHEVFKVACATGCVKYMNIEKSLYPWTFRCRSKDFPFSLGFYTACKYGYEHLLRKLLLARSPVSFIAETLYTAIASGDHNILKILLIEDGRIQVDDHSIYVALAAERYNIILSVLRKDTKTDRFSDAKNTLRDIKKKIGDKTLDPKTVDHKVREAVTDPIDQQLFLTKIRYPPLLYDDSKFHLSRYSPTTTCFDAPESIYVCP